MKLILQILLTAICFAGCVKEYSFEKGEDYFFKCKVNGVPKTFASFSAGYLTDLENGNLYIAGTIIPDSPSDTLAFEIYNTAKKIVPGNYTDTDPDFQMIGSYIDSLDRKAYVAGSSFIQLAASSGVTINNHFVVDIAELSDYHVRGTFGGDFYAEGDPHGAVVNITDGEFYIRLK